MPRMVEYDDTDLFPAPRDRLWKLLTAHLDDSTIGRIHPLIKAQRTLSKDGDDTTVLRSIDVRGKLLSSQWKVTLQPPDFSKYEILASEGPWSEGASVENHYSEAPGGTTIQSHIRLHVKALPFFLPQKTVARRILNDIDKEDRTFLSHLP